jgi:photosystem II stability/assembly factor-like uncharacterized protein
MAFVLRLLAVGALAVFGQAYGNSVTVGDPSVRPALMSRVATQSVLQAVTRAGNRLVAVGERGIVLLSDDSGQSWRQAKVPVTVTLTAATFPTARHGWAVGHFGVVLHSEDGGETWVRQLDGVAAARLALTAAQAGVKTSGAADPTARRLLAEAQRLEKDGPDKPFFDLHFENEKSGFVVGAYNLMFRTEDGGKTWQYWSHRLDNPKASHIYAIRAAGDEVYLAGEQGLLARSRDGGKSFARLVTPYQGSYFALAVLPAGEIVVAGLRGNAYRSADHGASWRKVDIAVPVSVTTMTLVKGGTLLLANQAGQILLSRDSGQSMQVVQTPPLAPVNGVEGLADGALLVVGLRGVQRIPAGAAPAAGRGGE